MLRSITLHKIQTSAFVLLAGASLLAMGAAGCTNDAQTTAPNHAPNVDASVSFSQVLVGTAVNLDASRSADADKDELKFAWSLVAPAGSKAIVFSPSNAGTSFIPDVPGHYALTVDVSDGKDKATQSFDVTAIAGAQDAAPTAHATTESLDVDVGSAILLDGSASADPDPNDAITFAWSLASTPAGSHAAIRGASDIRPTITFDLVGDYAIQLVVTDSHGKASAPATLAMTGHERAFENHKPRAIADSSALSVKVGQPVTVDGTKSSDPDAGDAITYAWAFVKTPVGSAAKLVDATASTTAFTPDVEGEYVVGLVVVDSHGAASGQSEVTVQATPAIVNAPPTAKASASAEKVRPAKSVTLDGSKSSDPDPNDVITYAWSLTSAPAASTAAIASGDAVKASFAFVPDREGDYQFSLVVTDSKGAASAPATVIVSALASVDSAPTALLATPPADAKAGAIVALDGSGSTDPDGDTLSFAWSIVSAPAASVATLTDAGGGKAALATDLAGSYVVALVVTDDLGMASAPVNVTVNAVHVDGAPVAVAAAAKTDVTTGDTATLDATGSTDPEGDVLTFAWSIVSAPAGSAVALSDSSAAKPTFVADVDGAYTFALVVNDGTTSSAEARITVNASTLPPIPTTPDPAPTSNARRFVAAR